LLAEAREIRDHAKGLMARAEGSGDLRLALLASREALRALETMGRLVGQIDSVSPTSVTVNVTNNTVVLIQAAIIRALADEPSAKAKVIQALEQIEGEVAAIEGAGG
jgi:hypothetical protein